jgi:hypothetical protein
LSVASQWALRVHIDFRPETEASRTAVDPVAGTRDRLLQRNQLENSACGMNGFPNSFNYGSLWECFAFMLLLSLGPARL